MTVPAEILRLKRLSTGSSAPPDDIVFEARRRLRWAALVYAGAFLLAYGLPRIIYAGEDWSGQAISDLIAGVAIGSGLLLALMLGPARRLSGRAFFKIGLFFEVISSFCIAMSEYWFFFHPEHIAMHDGMHLHGISWVCVWILAFPAIVPASLKQATIATLLSASSTPLVLLASLLHHESGGLSDEVIGNIMTTAVVSNTVAALMAIVVSRLIHGLTRKVSEARNVGSYELEELIGKGGMGEVWKARHRLLARPAAVKVVRPDALQTNDRERAQRVLKRFKREAEATAQLRCPHSIGLYDFGIADDGTFYYVMELLEGLTLEDLVERYGPQPAERVVHLLCQACESLDEAHQRGLVHRDVKPANIFCCRYGLDLDFVKVLDFGLVKSREHLRTSATKLTVDGAAAGTPAYMAPEAITGDSELDARSDIYALGCVAYWLLTGRLVFDASTPMRMAVMHIEERPLPASAVTEMDVPEALDQLVIDCLAKSPNDRPQSMAAFRLRLEQLELGRRWTRERAEAWWQKHQPVDSETGSFVSRGSTPAVMAATVPER